MIQYTLPTIIHIPIQVGSNFGPLTLTLPVKPILISDLQNYLSELTKDPKRSCLVKSRILCKTLASNSVHILTISNPSKNSQSDDKNKKMILITARVHPGETNGSWMMKGFLDYITSADPDANTLRPVFISIVFPATSLAPSLTFSLALPLAPSARDKAMIEIK